MKDTRILMDECEQKAVMLNILKEFAAFCELNGFSYFLDAGTLLGAVRHKGFIPWDDDIDVNMPRNDYDRFIKMMKEGEGHIAEHLKVEFPEHTVYPFAKISDDRTLLIEFPDKYPMEVGVYIDIFAKDGILDDSFSSKTVCMISKILGRLHWFSKFSIYAWRKSKNLGKKVVAVIGRVCIKKGTMAIRLQDKLIHWNQKKHPLEKCKYVTTLTNGEFHKIAPKECFSRYVMLDFENQKFRCPVGYDTYLKCLYPGDYMQLPPENKRVHHNTVVYWKTQEDKAEYYKNA